MGCLLQEYRLELQNVPTEELLPVNLYPWNCCINLLDKSFRSHHKGSQKHQQIRDQHIKQRRSQILRSTSYFALLQITLTDKI